MIDIKLTVKDKTGKRYEHLASFKDTKKIIAELHKTGWRINVGDFISLIPTDNIELYDYVDDFDVEYESLKVYAINYIFASDYEDIEIIVDCKLTKKIIGGENAISQ